jgi:hypothetical protein
MQSLHLLWRGRATCHHADGRRALSAFNAPCPICRQTASRSSSRQRACLVCWQTVRRAKRRTVLTIPSTRSFPCTPRIRRSRASGHEKLAPAANICSSKRYILYVPGPTCRGPVPLYMSPFSYKRGGMRRYKTDPSTPWKSSVHGSWQTSLALTSGTEWRHTSTQ